MRTSCFVEVYDAIASIRYVFWILSMPANDTRTADSLPLSASRKFYRKTNETNNE